MAYTQSDSTGGNIDLTLRRILKMIQQGPAPDQGRSLISTISLLVMERECEREYAQ